MSFQYNKQTQKFEHCGADSYCHDFKLPKTCYIYLYVYNVYLYLYISIMIVIYKYICNNFILINDLNITIIRVLIQKVTPTTFYHPCSIRINCFKRGLAVLEINNNTFKTPFNNVFSN